MVVKMSTDVTISRRFSFARRFRRNQNGAIAIEFAFGAMALIWMVVGIIEFGMILFTSTLMEGALRDASRYAITGQESDPDARLTAIMAILKKKTVGLVDVDTAQVDILVYPGFDQIGAAEDFTDGNANGEYDEGETYDDFNGNGLWDSDIGEPGPGNASDVVLYRLQINWALKTPLMGHLLSDDGTVPLRASIAVRNEPWDASTATAGGGAGS